MDFSTNAADTVNNQVYLIYMYQPTITGETYRRSEQKSHLKYGVSENAVSSFQSRIIQHELIQRRIILTIPGEINHHQRKRIFFFFYSYVRFRLIQHFSYFMANP